MLCFLACTWPQLLRWKNGYGTLCLPSVVVAHMCPYTWTHGCSTCDSVTLHLIHPNPAMQLIAHTQLSAQSIDLSNLIPSCLHQSTCRSGGMLLGSRSYGVLWTSPVDRMRRRCFCRRPRAYSCRHILGRWTWNSQPALRTCTWPACGRLPWKLSISTAANGVCFLLLPTKNRALSPKP